MPTQRCGCAFDLWMRRAYPDLPWCRYADDGLVHCRTEHEAEAVKTALQARLSECRLELHPTKTRIVYCKVTGRRGMYPNVKFDFLGYCFRPRRVLRPSDRKVVGGFTPAVSPTALKAMRAAIRDLNIRRSTQVSLADIARKLNPLLTSSMPNTWQLLASCSGQLDECKCVEVFAGNVERQTAAFCPLRATGTREPKQGPARGNGTGKSVDKAARR